MNKLFTLASQADGRSLSQLVGVGFMTELNYMTAEEQEAAIALEEELTLDALAGVDLRIRLIGAKVSPAAVVLSE